MEFVERLVDVLQKGGPWTMAAICMVVSVYLYRQVQDMHRDFSKEKQELNDRLIAMTAKQVEVLTVVNENQKQLVAAVKLLEG
jgi:hypothetical protein